MDSTLPTLSNMIDPDNDNNNIYNKKGKDNNSKDNMNNIKTNMEHPELQEIKQEKINNIKKKRGI